MRTLGDPVRLEIVRLLADGRPRVCSELSSALGHPGLDGLVPPAAPPRGRRDAHPAPQGTQRLISLRRDDLEARFPGLVDVLTR